MRKVLIYPHPILRAKCQSVPLTDDTFALAGELLSMVGPEVGRGIAAPQIGEPLALFATHVSPSPPKIYINPKITHFSEETIILSEGCRSLPDLTPEIERPTAITITATNLEGNSFTETLDGWDARVTQHEYDHLFGILNIDRLP